MPIGTALALGIGGLASAASGIGNLISNMSANDRAAALQDQNLQNWIKIQIPDPAQQKLALQQFVQQGKLDPKLQSAIQQDPSAFSQITQNAGDRVAQNRALQQLQDIGDQGGLTLADKSNLQGIQLDQAAKDKANRDSIAASMAQRGLGGSGFELQSQLAGQQQAADQAGKNSLSVAADAQARALQAIQQGGQLANQQSQQDFSQQAQRAQAQDAINRFNTQNLQSVQQQNVQSQNDAQKYNLNLAQTTANQNTDLANQQQKYNQGLLQQNYENQAQKAAGMSGQYNQAENLQTQKGAQIGNTVSNIGQGISGVGSTLANQNMWQQYLDESKKNPNLKAPPSTP